MSVGDSPDWRSAIAAQAARWGEAGLEEAGFGDVLVTLRDEAETLDVIVTEAHSSRHGRRGGALRPLAVLRAHAWLPDKGPAVFAPGTSEPDDRRGLRCRRSGRHAADRVADARRRAQARSASRTLERAVGRGGTPPQSARHASFTDAVIELLPQSRTT